MWILENDGDALKGKKLWLRPGKKFLFGRTKAEDGQFVVLDKTISRKHLTVEVDSSRPNDCPNPRSRSRVVLTDLNTKIGTIVNEEQIRGKDYVLDKDDNVIILGKYKYPFRFTWVPTVFTFSFTTKEHKADPYTRLYELLGPLDIKVLVDYERGFTTHVVAKKRNTSKGLQALIDGKYIVHNDSFINAVVAATTPTTEDGPAPLEEDFEANFPDPLQYLPPRGDEPTQRDTSAYAPDPARKDMFEGYTFVFYETRQFDTLLRPITEGGGKAQLRVAIPGETTVNDFVRYVKGVAGEKGLGEFEDGSEGKGVVVVRFNPVKGEGTEWFAEFGRQVALNLDHRLVEQNEFLDAILGNDARVLRRPLEIELSGAVAPPPIAATNRSSQTLRSSPPPISATPAEIAPPEPPRRGRSRRAARPQFKGFDDDFSGPSILNTVPESMVVDQIPAIESQSQGLFVSQHSAMDVDPEVSQPGGGEARNNRKRPSPIFDEEEEEEDIMEQLAPAAAALKRRRLADENDRRRRGESTPPSFQPPVKEQLAASKPLPRKSKKDIEQIDILEVARQQREKAEALAKAEREALQEQLEGMDISSIRNLAKIEEMEVKRANPLPKAAAHADESERWDDKWNGRKNFKKFRRRGAAPANARRAEKIIIELEEVKKKDFGIGDEYWGEDDSQRKRKKNKGKGKEIQAQIQDASQMESQSNTKSRAAEKASRILASEAEEEYGRPSKAADSDSDLEILEASPNPIASGSQKEQILVGKTNVVQNKPVPVPAPVPTTRTGNKRAAATTLTKQAPAKKPKPTRLENEDSDDSGDELKFRFRTRR